MDNELKAKLSIMAFLKKIEEKKPDLKAHLSLMVKKGLFKKK